VIEILYHRRRATNVKDDLKQLALTITAMLLLVLVAGAILTLIQ
jgi:hypothetical protein